MSILVYRLNRLRYGEVNFGPGLTQFDVTRAEAVDACAGAPHGVRHALVVMNKYVRRYTRRYMRPVRVRMYIVVVRTPITFILSSNYNCI